MLQKAYDELRQEMPQECDDFLIVEKIKERVLKNHPEVGTLDGVQIRNPLSMKLMSTKDKDFEEKSVH